jgi:hypothetical protein
MNKFNRAILKKDMTEIQEISLDVEPPPDIAESVTDVSEALTVEPKRRGRPAGAKNKAKATPAPTAPAPAQRAPRVAAPPATKPKAKRRVVVPSSDESSEEDQPRAPRTSRAPPELDRRALAADVLGLLQEQRMNRTVAKRNHYASWFENM